MLRVKFDSKELNAMLGNAVKFSYGFLDGIDVEQTEFNRRLGEFTVQALEKYIDAAARANPESLHHVYEWNQTGSPSARLFKINSRASKRVIHFEGKFLQSSSISQENSEPFKDKAYIMENAIAIQVEPRASNVLAFESDGGMVFTSNAIYIEHPGGDAVAGSFGRVVDDFFDNYFTNGLLRPFIDSLSRPKEFAEYWPAGVKGGGKATGISAGRKYLKSRGAEIE